jgi:hypothetical protein
MTLVQTRPQSPAGKALSLKKKLAFSLVVTASFVLCLYLGSLCLRSLRLYSFVKDGQRGWRGRALTPDPMLGYAPRPGSTGLELVPHGPAIPVRFDADGFRVPFDQPVAATGSEHAPSLLTLGCSFTYGEVCSAEETYTGVLSRLTGLKGRNAGVTSYGLAQMLILARRLIPQHRPAYVVVQYSPWLTQRAQNFYAHIAFGSTPVPFFVESPGGAVSLHPPVFLSRAAAMSVDDYRGKPAGLGDYLSFLFQIGAPLLLYDDYHIGIHRLRRLTGLTPAPAADPHQIEAYVYREIADLCQKYHSRMMILVLGNTPEPVPHAGLDRLQLPGARIVDAHAVLLGRLPERTPAAFRASYGHWRGDPPVFVDEHPNPAAHAIIAQELARAMGVDPSIATGHRPAN